MDDKEATLRKQIMDLMMEINRPDYRRDAQKERQLDELYKQLPGGSEEFIID